MPKVVYCGIISLCMLRRMTIHNINLHSSMKKIMHQRNVRNYEAPSLEVVSVEVEQGFSLSNNQEPSPWEDM